MKWSSGSCRPAVGRRVQTSAVGCARQSGAVGCARQSGATARRSGAAWRVGAEAWRVRAAAWRVGAAAWQSGRGSRALWSGRAFGCSPYNPITHPCPLIQHPRQFYHPTCSCKKTILLILSTPSSMAGPCFSPFFGWWASTSMHV